MSSLSASTNYSITDENGRASTISLPKLVADVLQTVLPNVHLWIQETYDGVVRAYRGSLSRRETGNVVRRLAREEAQKHPLFDQLHKEVFDL